MLLKSKEMDRYFWFHTDSSIRDGMSWNDFCNTIISVPNIRVQKKYVEIYHALIRNQQCYEDSLSDLKLSNNIYIEKLIAESQDYPLGEYIENVEERNEELLYGIDCVRGVSIEKNLIDTKANMNGVGLKNYKKIYPGTFVYVPVTSRNGEKISLALNCSKDTYICSSSYIVFRSKDLYRLYPGYLCVLFDRSEFDRYARYHSWGTARETFDWSEMCKAKIPIPDIKIQHAIADIYEVYTKRKIVNESLKTQIKNICPILIRGAMEEAGA